MKLRILRAGGWLLVPVGFVTAWSATAWSTREAVANSDLRLALGIGLSVSGAALGFGAGGKLSRRCRNDALYAVTYGRRARIAGFTMVGLGTAAFAAAVVYTAVAVKPLEDGDVEGHYVGPYLALPAMIALTGALTIMRARRFQARQVELSVGPASFDFRLRF